ncbi:hypothetical protein AXF42_Ash008655 [Apostasia shenzhenica]|uniref:Uncharacterized protein n=1 Tax=Apostasia shenzhenica TaxID=1088818 RepID=A0A2I0B200_9ASPA|nr:hypothetical protein AXF42_Ash008655 [Apostasia shenzhenica]
MSRGSAGDSGSSSVKELSALLITPVFLWNTLQTTHSSCIIESRLHLHKEVNFEEDDLKGEVFMVIIPWPTLGDS